MNNENHFPGEPNLEKKITPPTKETAREKLFEKFKMKDTSNFRSALQAGEIEKATEWLNYIIDNKDDFPQYQADWDNWLKDRQKEIEIYQELKDNGTLEKIKPRTKEEAQLELIKMFNFGDTTGFRSALAKGEVELAEKWLDHIITNKDNFPQYQANWDNWLRDRQRELARAKNNQ